MLAPLVAAALAAAIATDGAAPPGDARGAAAPAPEVATTAARGEAAPDPALAGTAAEPAWEIPVAKPRPPPRALRPRQTRILVADFTTAGDVPQEVARALVDAAAREASRVEGVLVLTQADLVSQLGVEHTRQMLGCAADGSCLAELAGALDAGRSIRGNVSAVAGGIAISLSLVESRDLTSIRARGDFVAAARLEPLLDSVRRLTYEVVTGRSFDATGILDVEVTEPDSVVLVNQEEIGDTPLRESRRVSPGQYQVAVMKGERITWATEVRVEAGGRTTVRPQLRLPAAPPKPPKPPAPWLGPHLYVQAIVGTPDVNPARCQLRSEAPETECRLEYGARVGWEPRRWVDLEGWFTSAVLRSYDFVTSRDLRLETVLGGGAVLLKTPGAAGIGIRLAAGAGRGAWELRGPPARTAAADASGFAYYLGADVVLLVRYRRLALELSLGAGQLSVANAPSLPLDDGKPLEDDLRLMGPVRVSLGFVWPPATLPAPPSRRQKAGAPPAPEADR